MSTSVLIGQHFSDGRLAPAPAASNFGLAVEQAGCERAKGYRTRLLLGVRLLCILLGGLLLTRRPLRRKQQFPCCDRFRRVTIVAPAAWCAAAVRPAERGPRRAPPADPAGASAHLPLIHRPVRQVLMQSAKQLRQQWRNGSRKQTTVVGMAHGHDLIMQHCSAASRPGQRGCCGSGEAVASLASSALPGWPASAACAAAWRRRLRRCCMRSVAVCCPPPCRGCAACARSCCTHVAP